MDISSALLLMVSIATCIGLQLEPSDFLIESLPLYNSSFDDIPFKQYAGYIPLPDEDETTMFFWFVESQNSPSTDPISLWLTGGPGDSSLHTAFWDETGPFRLYKDTAYVYDYKWSWNRISSVIYLESPSGVGFSYSNKSSGYNCSDAKTAKINYLFLVEFFKIFTQFTSNDFYLTGASYAGHYVPQLAQYIIQHGKQDNIAWSVNGLYIGNPATDQDSHIYGSTRNDYAFITFLYEHALLPQVAYIQANKACDWNEFLINCSMNFTDPTQECLDAVKKAREYEPQHWDEANIYASACNNMTDYMNDNGYNPCETQWIDPYMNREDVLTAIHAISHYNSSRPWPDKPNGWHYQTSHDDITTLYPYFFENEPKWKITIVSGDVDALVPFIGTQRWIECLHRKVDKDWFDWYLDGDIAGIVKVYDGITFQTAKNCGHEIPKYCNEKGFLMFQQYLNGTYS